MGSPETGVHLHTDIKRPAKFHAILHISYSVIVRTRKVYGRRTDDTDKLPQLKSKLKMLLTTWLVSNGYKNCMIPILNLILKEM